MQIINMLGLVSLVVLKPHPTQIATQVVVLMIVAIQVTLDHLLQDQEDNSIKIMLNEVANQWIATFFF